MLHELRIHCIDRIFLSRLNKTHLLKGITMALFGDFLRKFSMYWCGPGFTHLIQYNKRKDHVLVTDGPYRFVRHPGYTGWAIWAISTQGKPPFSPYKPHFHIYHVSCRTLIEVFSYTVQPSVFSIIYNSNV